MAVARHERADPGPPRPVAVHRNRVIHRAHDRADGSRWLDIRGTLGSMAGTQVRESNWPRCRRVRPRAYAHHQEAATRVVRRRSSESRVSTWICLLWSMALLGLLLLPATTGPAPKARTRIRSSSSGQTRPTGPFATTLTTGWCIRFEAFHLRGLTHPSAPPIDRDHGSSMTSGSMPRSNKSRRLVERRAPAPDRHDGDRRPGNVPGSHRRPYRRYSGLSPRILVPPPRWMPAA